MNTGTPSSDTDPLVELAEEYAERFRRGERPALTEYTDKYPDLADRIRKLFPALVVMEEFGSVAGPSTDPHANGTCAPPRQLGDYRILREVGRGGMGVVYEAVQESLGRHVALKVLPAQNWKNPVHLERFRREARAVARLHHTNIVPVFGRGDVDGTHYYAMQFIQGQSLDCVLHELKRLRRARSAAPGDSTDDPPTGTGHRHSLSASIATGLIFGKFPDASVTPEAACVRPNPPTDARTTPPVTSWGGEGRSGCPTESSTTDGGNRSELTAHSDDQYFRGVARIGVQAAEALAYAHQQGILHRDVKPSNLLLDTQGTIWVTDFGLAKAEDSEELTSAGDIVGTIRYMAPERFKGHADPRSDVYALGLTLFEMLTLKPAYDSTDRARLIDRITRENPTAPRSIDPRIPRDFETIVLKAIAREPAARYASAAALADDLQRFLADRPIRARRTSWAGHTWRWCRRNPVVAGLLTTVAALLVVTVVVLAASNARIGRALEQEIEAKDRAEQTLYYQWVAQAAEARDKNRAARAEEFLDRCPSRLRGWEWHYLKRLPFALFPAVELGDELILRVAFNSDGGLLAVGTVEGRVSVWNARTGTPVLAPFQAQKEMIRGTAFSPDNRCLATGGNDDRVRLWDLRTGEPIREFPLEGPAVLLTLKFSPNGRQLAASDQDQRIWVWDVETGARTRLDSPDRLAIHGLEFSADSQQLLSVSTEGVVTAWDVAGRSAARAFDAGFPGVHVVAFSPDRRQIALGNEHGTVRVIQTDPWQRAWDLEAHTTAIQALAFGSGGDRLATSAASDITVRLWDMRTGQEALSADCVGSRENALAFSPDGHRLATGNTKGTIRILDGTPLDGPGDGGQVLTLEGHTHAVGWLSYSPNGARIASASSNGTIKLWDARSGESLRTLPAGDSALTGVAFSADGGRLVASSWDGAVRLWGVDTGREIYEPRRAQAGPVYGVAFSRDDRAFASAHHDGTVRVWDADTGEPRRVIRAHPHPVLGLAFSPDGEFLVSTGGKDHCARIWKWDADNQGPVLTLTGQRGILRNPVYSPDGRRVAALISGMRYVCLWDVSPGGGAEREATRLTIPGTGGLISLVVFHPDGRRLIVVSDDQLQLLDPDTGVVKPLPAAHAGDIRSAALSPDGKFLATGAGYRGRGEVRIWDASRWEKP